jgi:hypothetical protein
MSATGTFGEVAAAFFHVFKAAGTEGLVALFSE